MYFYCCSLNRNFRIGKAKSALTQQEETFKPEETVVLVLFVVEKFPLRFSLSVLYIQFVLLCH